MTSSLYAQLPETSEIQFAREMTELQSEVQHIHARTPRDCPLVVGCSLITQHLSRQAKHSQHFPKCF